MYTVTLGPLAFIALGIVVGLAGLLLTAAVVGARAGKGKAASK